MTPSRIVGIDLGTTNTVVAEAVLAPDTKASILGVPQLVASGEVAREALFPSVLFRPPAAEGQADPFGDAPWILGSYARVRARAAPNRSITSAKSWLCHAGVDRLGRILPWGEAPDDDSASRISPVEASRRILSHVRTSLDIGTEHAARDEHVVLTVPASFDEVARELTVRAANEAGLSVRLLEEPLAAFYDYLATSGTAGLEALLSTESREALVLVCDVGGGTTDLTLVRASSKDGALHFDRVAVGRHLLLGGDNMDLALAHSAEAAFVTSPERLDSVRFAELVLACRAAKEHLLASGGPDEVPIRVLSRGSQLVGGTLATVLSREDVRDIVLDGFFPLTDLGAPPAKKRTGFVGFGLPYEQDPAITRHIAAFLGRHSAAGVPSAVLLNGGVFNAEIVRDRVLEGIRRLTSNPCIALDAPDPDLAVARGAVEFGLALSGFGPRIGGGSARGYYVGLSGGAGTGRAVCVVPRGSLEGERHVVHVPGLSLVVGQPVRFDSFASDAALHSPGEIVAIDDTLDPLPSMTAAFEHESALSGRTLSVHLEGELTPIGTLDVACVEEARALTHPKRFRLAFDLKVKEGRKTSIPPGSARAPDAKLAAAIELLAGALGGEPGDVDEKRARHVVRELERILGERATWTTETARALFDAFIPFARLRKRTLEHERSFWMLAGFCLRPGYGHPLDERRVAKLIPLFQEAVAHAGEARVWQQFFIAWRRVSGGLGESVQTSIRDTVDPFLSTDAEKPKKRKGWKPQALDEMMELAASLERVPPSRRADLGRWILERTWSSRDPRLWAALGRVGARVPTYASAHYVIPTKIVCTWLDHLLREKWNEVPTAPRAALQMARVTADRARDVPEDVQREVARRLSAAGAPAEWVRAVTELVPVQAADRAEFFGEGLPVGLVLEE